MTRPPRARRLARGIGLVLSTLLVGCGSLIPKPAVLPAFYSLDESRPSDSPAADRPASMRTMPTLAVQRTLAAAGFDSARIVYTREAHRLETFAHSEWVDTPSRMLTPLIVSALRQSGAWPGVVMAPSAAVADITLDTEIVRLQHDFTDSPSRVRFTLRAVLVESRTGRVLATQEFDERADSASDDARGGVDAAHRVVQQVLQRLTTLCNETAASWHPPSR